MKISLQTSIAAVRRRFLAAAWMRTIGPHFAALAFIGGTACLLSRTAGWDRAAGASWLAVTVLAPLSAWWIARKQVPGAESCATWLDVRGGASGMVVTESEVGVTAWTPQADARLRESLNALPALDATRALRTVLPALAFAVLVVWIDPPKSEIGPPPAVADAAIERIEEKLATLEEVLAMEPEAQAELQEQLENARAEAEEGRAESAFEALDRIEQQLEQHAEEAEQAAHRARHELNEAVDDPSLADAQTALENALAQMAKAGLDKDLPKMMNEALTPGSLTLPEGTQLSSAELAKLSQALKGALDGKVGRLAQGKLLDANALAKLGELGSLDDFDDTHECDADCKKPGGT